jgi:uncharacterized membrane protein
MDANYCVSQILGIILLSMSLGFAIQPQHYQTVFHELMSHAGSKFLSGMIPLITGTLLILTHHTWENAWGIFIGVLCWSIFIKGLMRIVIPKISDRMILKCIDRPEYVRISVAIGLIFGVALCYHGFLGG